MHLVESYITLIYNHIKTKLLQYCDRELRYKICALSLSYKAANVQCMDIILNIVLICVVLAEVIIKK